MTSSETWVNQYFSVTEQQAWAELLPLAEIDVKRKLNTDQDEEKTGNPYTDFILVKVKKTHMSPPLEKFPVLQNRYFHFETS